MLAWLKQRRDRRETARELYGSIVTQARLPVFYEAWGVPDTVQGRFEMIALHLALALHRLHAEGGQAGLLARALTERFVGDVNDSVREMTVSDLAVPREVKRAAAALFDRHEAYLAGLAAPHDMSVRTALDTQLAYLGHSGLKMDPLSRYVRGAANRLAEQPSADVLAGQLKWPEPATIVR